MEVVHALSVDVEDWYQVSAYAASVARDSWEDRASRIVANTQRVLDLLDRFDVRATFFVLGWEAERRPELVHAIHERGHEVACHGYSHRCLWDLDPTTFSSELDRAVAALSDITGERPQGFRAPDFSIGPSTLWALDVLAEHGFAYDSSIYPVDFMRYGIPEFPLRPTLVTTRSGSELIEFPLTSCRIATKRIGAAGGAYLRLLPPALVRRGLRQAERRNEPGCIYFHPWELDPGQPRLKAARRTTYRQAHNTDVMERRLEDLLGRFRFAPIQTCLDRQRAEGQLSSLGNGELVVTNQSDTATPAV